MFRADHTTPTTLMTTHVEHQWRSCRHHHRRLQSLAVVHQVGFGAVGRWMTPDGDELSLLVWPSLSPTTPATVPLQWCYRHRRLLCITLTAHIAGSKRLYGALNETFTTGFITWSREKKWERRISEAKQKNGLRLVPIRFRLSLRCIELPLGTNTRTSQCINLKYNPAYEYVLFCCQYVHVTVSIKFTQ